MNPARKRLQLWAAVLVSSWSHIAHAAPCGRPDVDFTFPPDSAQFVPSNAGLAAHYSAPPLYSGELASLTDAAGAAVPATTTFDEVEALLRVTPEAPLADGTYGLEWPSLRGLTAGPGLGKKQSFTVAQGTDQAAPRFAGLVGLEWDLARDRDPCTDRLEDRFVFKLKAGEASDDRDVSLLALQLFETRDPAAPADGAPEKVGLRAWPASGEVELRRPASEAGSTCFAAIVQDLVGNVSGGGERQVCVKTQKPPFFEGCNIARMPRHAASGSLWLVLAALGLSYRRRGRGEDTPTWRAG